MACQNLVMLVAFIFTALVLGAKVTVLAQSCKPALSTCINILVAGEINNENECDIQRKYLPCLDTALKTVKCDSFSSLALRYTAIEEYNTVNSKSACNIVVSNQFQFDDACTKQMAVCGQYINNVLDNANIGIYCSSLGDFETCMKFQTTNCSRTVVNDLIQRELSSFNYTSSCIDTTTTSTSPSTKATMTTTQQTTPASSTSTLTTKVPTTPSFSMTSSTNIAPSSTPTSPQQTTQKPAPSTIAPTTPSLLMPSTTKIAPSPTPVTPSLTSRTSTSEGTTTLPKPSSSLPNTKIVIGTNSGSTDSLCSYLLMIETLLVMCLQHIFVL